ncbi:hypothetical protein HK102_011905, partial [Quaeritorhiza haematococci]
MMHMQQQESISTSTIDAYRYHMRPRPPTRGKSATSASTSTQREAGVGERDAGADGKRISLYSAGKNESSWTLSLRPSLTTPSQPPPPLPTTTTTPSPTTTSSTPPKRKSTESTSTRRSKSALRTTNRIRPLKHPHPHSPHTTHTTTHNTTKKPKLVIPRPVSMPAALPSIVLLMRILEDSEVGGVRSSSLDLVGGLWSRNSTYSKEGSRSGDAYAYGKVSMDAVRGEKKSHSQRK